MSQNAVGLAFGGGMAEMKKQGQVCVVLFCFVLFCFLFPFCCPCLLCKFDFVQ